MIGGGTPSYFAFASRPKYQSTEHIIEKNRIKWKTSYDMGNYKSLPFYHSASFPALSLNVSHFPMY
jgi:hypothetical protein